VFRPPCLLSGPMTEPIHVLFRTNFQASHWLEIFEPSRVPSLPSDPYSEPGSQSCSEPVAGALAWSSSTCEVCLGTYHLRKVPTFSMYGVNVCTYYLLT
jgi:hypothetical protein